MRSSMRRVQAAEIFAQSAGAGRAVFRQFGEFNADLLQRQAHALGEDDEGDPPQHLSGIATMA